MTTTTTAGLRQAHDDHRLPGLAGLLATTLMLAAFLLVPADAGGTSPDDVAARYAQGAAGYLRAAALETASLVMTAVLVAGLAVWVGRRNAGAGMAAAIGGAVLVTCQLAGYAVIVTLAHGTAATAGTDVVTALYDLSAVLFTVANGGLALLSAAVGLVVVRRHRVLGALSGITAAAAAAGAVALFAEGFASPHGDLGFLVLVLQIVWTAAAGVTLLRVARRRQPTSRDSRS